MPFQVQENNILQATFYTIYFKILIKKNIKTVLS